MTTTRTVGLVAALAIAGLVLVVTGGTDPVAQPDDDGVLEITLRDYGFEPDEVVLPSGEQLTLRLVNLDDASHHVSFGRDVLEDDGRAVAFEEDLFDEVATRVTPVAAEASPNELHEGFAVLVPGNDTVTIEVTIPAERSGTWEIGCFTGRGCHYRSGLAGTVVVE